MRTLPDAIVEQPTISETVSSAGDVPLAWPPLPAGTRATYTMRAVPEGSAATVTVVGNVEDVDLQGTYIVERSIFRGVQHIRLEAAVIEWPSVGSVLEPPVGSTRVDLASTATNSGTYSWTHADPPDGVVYALTVWDITSDTEVTPVGGSNLTGWNWTVETNHVYYAVLTAEDLDGQVAHSDVLVVTVANYSALAYPDAASLQLAAGTTTGTIVWGVASGGDGDYTYGDPEVETDSVLTSTGDTTAVLTGSVLSGLVDGQIIIVRRTVTDGQGTTTIARCAVVVAAAAASLTITAPASVSVAFDTSSVSGLTWSTASGGTGPYSYDVAELTGSAVAITGADNGPYEVVGLAPNRMFVIQVTATDSLGATGSAICVISVAAAPTSYTWDILLEQDFRDGALAAFSSTNNTSSTSLFQHTLMAADGVTPIVRVVNTTTDARELATSAEGVELICTSGSAQPGVKMSPATYVFGGGSEDDLFRVDYVATVRVALGTASVSAMAGLSTRAAPSQASSYGLRVQQSGTGLRALGYAYIPSFSSLAMHTIPTGVSYREATYKVQVYLTRGYIVEAYFQNVTGLGDTDLPPVTSSYTGLRVVMPLSSRGITFSPTLFDVADTTVNLHAGIFLYLNASAGDKTIIHNWRWSRIPGGSRMG